jgi:ATP-binding protein involved in chromosome partitioning
VDLKSEIYNALSSVIDPELGMSVTELGMIKDVKIDSDTAEIDVALTISGCPLRVQIRKDVENKILSLKEIKNVKVNFTTLSAEEKSKIMDKVRKHRSENPDTINIDLSTQVLAVSSGKGGVGKSTISANLATSLARSGLTIGLLDADIGGFSIPRLLGIRSEIQVKNKKMLPAEIKVETGLLKVLSMGFLAKEESAIMWRGLLLNKAVSQFLQDADWGHLDYLIIDMPPGTSDIQLGLTKLLPRAQIIVVTTPSSHAKSVAARVADMAKKGYLRVVGVIENMSYFECDHNTRYEIFGRGAGQELAEELGVDFIGSIAIYPEQAGERPEAFKLEFDKIADSIKKLVPIIEPKSCSAKLLEAIESSL